MSTYTSTDKGVEAEREEFEAWARDPVRAEKLPLDRWPTNGGYKDTRTYIAFYAWKAARRAHAPVADGLPALPTRQEIARYEGRAIYGYSVSGYSDEQVRKYARDAIAADRQARPSVPAAGAVQQPVGECVHKALVYELQGLVADLRAQLERLQKDRDGVADKAIEMALQVNDLEAQLAQHERVHKIMVDTVRDLGQALHSARDMVGHPENIAFIDRAIATAGISGAAPAPGNTAQPVEQVGERVAANRDKARLDFLDTNVHRFRMGWEIGAAPVGNLSVRSIIMGGRPIREAIDIAMANIKGATDGAEGEQS